MKTATISLGIGGLLAAGVLAAAPANAQPAHDGGPGGLRGPVPEGIYVQTTSGGKVNADIQVRYDCGPGCFTLDQMSKPGPGTQYRYNPVSNRWENSWVYEPVATHCTPAGAPEETADGEIRYFTTNGKHFQGEYNIFKSICGVSKAEASSNSNANPDTFDLTPA